MSMTLETTLPHDQVVLFEESWTFEIHENHRYLNVSALSKSENGTNVAGRGDHNVLLGYIRRKRNPVPEGITGPLCSWVI
jgi:hypothetical protein